MARKPGPKMLFPIGLRGEDTGDAVIATCWSEATRKFKQYQRALGSNYYLMQPIVCTPANVDVYREVCVERQQQPPSAIAAARNKKKEALERQARMMRTQHLD